MKLEVTLQHRRLDVNSDDILTNPELVIIDFRSRYKGDSGVHTGNSPTDYDDVWIDPEGDAATAQHILADNGKSVQENLDEADKKMFQLQTKAPNTLPVTVTGTAIAPIYTFTKANFDTVAQSYANGAQIFVDFTDNRTAANKPIDLNIRPEAVWNKTLSQIEVSRTEIARGFYLDGARPSDRGAVSDDTQKYIDAGAEFNAPQGVYYLNEIALSESEIAPIYTLTASNLLSNYWTELLMGCRFKTNFWLSKYANKGSMIASVVGNGCFIGNSTLVTAKIAQSESHRTYFASVMRMFNATPMLNRVIGIIDCNTSNAINLSNIFLDSGVSSFRFARLNANIAFDRAPNIDRESILYLVNNSINTTAITVTMMPEVLARLTPEDIALASSRKITLTA